MRTEPIRIVAKVYRGVEVSSRKKERERERERERKREEPVIVSLRRGKINFVTSLRKNLPRRRRRWVRTVDEEE